MEQTALTGFHHLTAIVGDPQENVDFYTRVLGQRREIGVFRFLRPLFSPFPVSSFIANVSLLNSSTSRSSHFCQSSHASPGRRFRHVLAIYPRY